MYLVAKSIQTILEKPNDYLRRATPQRSMFKWMMYERATTRMNSCTCFFEPNRYSWVAALSCISNPNPRLKRMISDHFMEQVPNMLDHVKMLPVFLEMGYSRREFIQDYDTDKFTWLDLGYILATFQKSWLRKKRYTVKGVDQHIGRYFAAKTWFDPESDYTLQLSRLRKPDEELFQILDKFFTGWENYDYDSDDSYHRFSLPFVESLDEWAGKRRIV